MRHIASHQVARMLGVKTATLAKWRREKRGPQQWFHLSPTLVVYPEDAVDRYLTERRRAEREPEP